MKSGLAVVVIAASLVGGYIAVRAIVGWLLSPVPPEDLGEVERFRTSRYDR